MRWHDLLAGLDGPGGSGSSAGSSSPAIPTSRSTPITHDSRRVAPGRVLRLHPRRGDRRPRPRARGRRPGRGGAARRAPAAARGVAGPGAERARRARARSPATLHGHPSAAMRVLGVTGTNGKTTTTYLLEAIAPGRRRPGRCRSAPSGARDRGRRRSRPQHTTPEASDLQALLARMRDAGRRHGRDGGVVARARPAPRRRRRSSPRCASPTSATSTSTTTARSTRTSRRRRAVRRATRATCAAVNLDDARGVELAARVRATDLDLWTFAVDDDARRRRPPRRRRSAPDGTASTLVDRRAGGARRVDLPLVGPFNLANALAAAATARAAGFSARRRSSTGSAQPLVVPGRFERIDAGQPFTVLVDYAHTPDALGRVLGRRPPPRRRRRPGGLRVRVRRRPRPGQAPADGRGGRATAPTSRCSPPTTLARRTRRRSPTRSSPASPRVRPRCTVELDRRVAIAAALAAAAPGDVVVIAGKGHETGQTGAGPHAPVRRPGRRA